MSVARKVGVGVVVAPRPNTRSNVEVVILQKFNRETVKVLGFLTVYKLFIRMKMRDDLVEE